MLSTNGKLGIGDILYESGEIAFDTDRSMFFNPKTKVDYGPTPPPGGWEIPWYAKGNQIIVPVGPAGVAKTQAEAQELKIQTGLSLASQIATRTKEEAEKYSYGAVDLTYIPQNVRPSNVPSNVFSTNSVYGANSVVSPNSSSTRSGIVSILDSSTFGVNNKVFAIGALVMVMASFFYARGIR